MAKQGNWKSELMAASCKAVTEGTLGVREAATQYNIPKSTLSRRLKRGIPSTLPVTRPPVFSIWRESACTSHQRYREPRFWYWCKSCLQAASQALGEQQTVHTEHMWLESSENYCGHCAGFYGDDDGDDEDWWQCTKCSAWFHETCTGLFGRATELRDFVCKECAL